MAFKRRRKFRRGKSKKYRKGKVRTSSGRSPGRAGFRLS